MDRGPLGEQIDGLVETVAGDLAVLSGRSIESLRPDVANDVANLFGAVIDADGRVTDDELWAYILGVGPILSPPLAITPDRLRSGGLLAGKAVWLTRPSTLFDLLVRADQRDAAHGCHTYYTQTLALAHRVAALDLVPSPEELDAIATFRNMMLATMDAFGVARPGGNPPSTASGAATPRPPSTAAGAPSEVNGSASGAAPATQPNTVITESTGPTLESLLAALDELVGLDEVKAEVRRLTSLLQIQQLRTQRGLPNYETSHHLVFTGNPGTGKTTVARLLSQIFHVLGIVSKGHLVETDRSGLVAGFVGQTATKTRAVLDTALGGMLLIDEAYALARGGENDFGREAVDTLVKYMEDQRDDLAVVAAGYPTEMKTFIDSNPGLSSRFARTLNFADYTDDQLVEIFCRLGDENRYVPSEGAIAAVRAVLATEPRGQGFGNARYVRNLFEAALARQAARLAPLDEPTTEELTTLIATDVI
jgi:AAA lid domain/ATPase family associated with various cellular activities (AAA)